MAMTSIKLGKDVTSWELDITRLYQTRAEEEAALLRALGYPEDADDTPADAEETPVAADDQRK
jgi:hypothetical protein